MPAEVGGQNAIEKCGTSDRSIVETAIDGPTAAPVLVFARESAARCVQVSGHQP